MGQHATTISLTKKQRAELKTRRVKRGLTQPELGSLAGCTHAMISQIESGVKSPGYGLLVAICKALGCKLTVTIKSNCRSPAELK